MTPPSEDEAVLVRYLLGQCSPDERDRVERRYFADDSYFELLEAVEARLNDDYAAGRLPPEEMAAFRSHYLASPRNRRQLQRADMFRRAVDALEPRQPVLFAFAERFWSSHRAFRYLAPALLLVLIIGTAYKLGRRPGEVTYFLPEGALRSMPGTEVTVVALPRSASSIRLRLEIASPVAQESERAFLRRLGESQALWSQAVRPRSGQKELEVDLDASNLSEGDYLLTLEGPTATTSSYSFRLTHK